MGQLTMITVSSRPGCSWRDREHEKFVEEFEQTLAGR